MWKFTEEEIKKMAIAKKNEIRKNVFRDAEMVARKIHRDVIDLCPVDSNDLRQALISDGLKVTIRGDKFRAEIGVSKTVIPYIWMVEYGTEPMINAQQRPHDPYNPKIHWAAKDAKMTPKGKVKKGMAGKVNPSATLPFIRTAFVMNEHFAKEHIEIKYKGLFKVNFDNLTPYE